MTIQVTQLLIFVLGSIGLIILSRQALGSQHFHGFPRLFAFEAILGLVVLNAPGWFVQPFTLIQLTSWALLLFSAWLAISAFSTLRRHGAIDPSIRDKSQISIEKTTRLITQGVYRHIRHPLYASLLYFTWGVLLKNLLLISILLALIASLALFLTAVYEEQENLRKFGTEYADYMKGTKRFIPFVF